MAACKGDAGRRRTASPTPRWSRRWRATGSSSASASAARATAGSPARPAFPQGLYLPGFSQDDAAGDIGDSAITETPGLGGFAMGGAPAVVKVVGGTPADAVAYTEAMYGITLARNPNWTLPPLGFAGTPTGIDVRKVVDTNVLPVINTGIAHKEAGIGQVGAGLVRPPMRCFTEALRD